MEELSFDEKRFMNDLIRAMNEALAESERLNRVVKLERAQQFEELHQRLIQIRDEVVQTKQRET